MSLTFTPRPARIADDDPALAEPAPADALYDDEPLVLPAAWQQPARAPLPLAASIAPVVAGVAVWAVTGSILALLLAGLGPIIAIATLWDARRAARGDRRRHDADARRAHDDIAKRVARRHEEERERLWARHPDVLRLLRREDAIWRGDESEPAIVVGAGTIASRVRIIGGEGDPAAARLRGDAARLRAAPVMMPLTTGIAVVGDGALAAAVHRALVLQACLALPPGRLRLVGDLPASLAWAERMPHRAATSGLRLAVVTGGESATVDADITLACAVAGAPLPPACAAVLSVAAPDRARIERAGEVIEIEAEAVSTAQAEVVAEALAERAALALGMAASADDPVSLTGVLADAPPAIRGSLPAVIGRAGARAVVVDLVADGPHAVVAGVTGAGKSELLITWVLALAATHTTAEVNFLLADFKGGTAFDALAELPHVTGVLTDLDGGGARRAIESLRAEVRWREAELARVGARDVRDARVALPRLVVVVDEFAALVGEHPELNAVFVDIAARGRALGLHLILGTQRAGGVLRENLLANCPLRLSLRVTDPGDSRAVIGTVEASELPGGAAGRGLALLRRGGDGVPSRVRIALSHADDVARIAQQASGPSPRRPWLPALPTRITLAEVRARYPEADGLVLGLADEPEHQRQRPACLTLRERGLLVVGGPGSGRTTALDTLLAQAPGRVVRVPDDPESAWDELARLDGTPVDRGSVIAIDDLDALVGLFPGDHAHEAVARLERLFRRAGESEILVLASAQRLTGATARLAELLPRRVLLPVPTRTDHVAAGGDPGTFVPDAPPGRGRLGGLALQVAMTERPAPTPPAATPAWAPQRSLTGIVTRRAGALAPAREQWLSVRWHTLDEHAAGLADVAERAVVLVGDPDDWQRHWRTLSAVRSDHDLVIDASCAPEYRVLAATRDLPPYAAGRGRAWLLSAGADAVRVILPGAGG